MFEIGAGFCDQRYDLGIAADAGEPEGLRAVGIHRIDAGPGFEQFGDERGGAEMVACIRGVI